MDQVAHWGQLLGVALFAAAGLVVRWLTVSTEKTLLGVSFFTGLALVIVRLADRTPAASLWHLFLGGLFCVMYGLLFAGRHAETEPSQPAADAGATPGADDTTSRGTS